MVGDLAQSKDWPDGSPQKLALHGLVGLIEAKVGDGSIAAGVLGAVAQEYLASELSAYLKANGFDYDDPLASPEERNQRRAEHDSLVQLGMTLAGTALGSAADGTQGAATGATAAYNGVTNNYLKHNEVSQLKDAEKKLQDCQSAGGDCTEEKQAVDDWTKVSKMRDVEINACRETGTCQKWLAEVQEDIGLLYKAIEIANAQKTAAKAQGDQNANNDATLMVVTLQAQLENINRIDKTRYQQLYVNARSEYMKTHPGADTRDFIKVYGANISGVTTALSALVAGIQVGTTLRNPPVNTQQASAGGVGGATKGGTASGVTNWTLGEGKSSAKWAGQMERRGWTPKQIDEALISGQKFPAQNNLNPANGATRYVHPETGRSVVIDNKTGQVIHVGGDGFKY
jgi:filamentous hemagglutinin